MSQQIKIYGTNISFNALYPLSSKSQYDCLNTKIVKGVCAAPTGIDDCYKLFPGVSAIGRAIGISSASDLWRGISGSTYDPGATAVNSLYLEKPSKEMQALVGGSFGFGPSFAGCYWPAPQAPYSANCPDIGAYYPSYLKLRLNVATFWNTPKQTPVKRREFLDSFKYARKAELVVSGDFNVRIGDVIELKLNNLSGYGTGQPQSVLSDYYWVIGVKHVFTNSGTHETHLRVTQMMPTVYSQKVF